MLGDAAGGTEQAVTGDTAGDADFNQTMKSRAPIVFAFVLGFAFLLLLLTFRSIVIPIKAIILNLLSVGAAYGVLVWIFQDGHLQGLLGFHSNGAVVTWLPLFLFTVLFGLSMDYHVFILSRDQGARRPGRPDRPGRRTRHPLHRLDRHERRGRDDRRLRDLRHAAHARHQAARRRPRGRGALDATLIRGVLLPATMKLLGELELVPAPLARMDARAERRSQAGRGRTLGASGPGRVMATERYDVAVIGGGQAGLAIGYFLKRQGTRFVIFDSAASIGAAWRARWDSLVLFTPRRYDSLPGLPFRATPRATRRATRSSPTSRTTQRPSSCRSRLGCKVRSITKDDDSFLLDVDGRTVEARQVVVATGPFQTPRVPDFAGERARGVPDSQPGLSSAQ